MLIQPMLCEPGELARLESLKDPEWIVEEKYDGERIIAQLEGGRVHMWTRRDLEVHHRFPEVVDALRTLRVKRHTVLDGELVVQAGFQGLHHRQTDDRLAIRVLSRKIPATYILFDLLILDRERLIDKPLSSRRMSLAALLPEDAPAIRRAPHFPADRARETFDRLVSQGGEGVIAKRLASVYEPGKRSRGWLKFKRVETVDVDIIGATRSDAGLPFASLMMMRDGRFFGNVGTGFTLEERDEILGILKRNASDKPATELPKDIDPVILTKPLPAEVNVSEILDAGMPRAPVWLRFKIQH